MAALTADGPNRFRVRFDELARRGLGRLRRRERVQVDPYLIGRGIVEVMDACTVRSAAGRGLLWNEYRVILARADFEALGPLAEALTRDLREALEREVAKREVDLLGVLRVTVVADEADDLEAGHAVVRAAFVPTERLAAPARGEMTVYFDDRARGEGAETTIGVPEIDPAAPAYLLRWPRGESAIAAGTTVLVGRAHPGSPRNFIALEGASPRINKQHFTITAGSPTVRISRLESANPVQVGDRALDPGGGIEATPPVQISLSKGKLVLSLDRA